MELPSEQPAAGQPLAGQPAAEQPVDKVVSAEFVEDWEYAARATTRRSAWSRWTGVRETLELEKDFWAARGVVIRGFREHDQTSVISQTLTKAFEAIAAVCLRAGVTNLSVFEDLMWTPEEAAALFGEKYKQQQSQHQEQQEPAVLEYVLFERVKQPDPKQVYRDMLVAKAFDGSPFLLEAETSLEGLRARLAMMATKWMDNLNFYAPYFALVNATMTGKSRLISQLRTKGVFVLIMCLRPEWERTLRPPRTESVARWIESASHTLKPEDFLNQCCMVELGLVNELTAWLVSQPVGSRVVVLAEQWYNHMHGPEGEKIWTRIVDEAVNRTINYAVPGADSNTPALVTDFIVSHWRGKIKRALKTFTDTLAGKCPEDERSSLTGEASDVRVLLVVDEASGLKKTNPFAGDLHVFLWFQRALQAFPFYDESSAKMFAVFTDTTSRIANLAPPAEVEVSGRVLAKHSLLFPPFTVLNTTDLWWNKGRLMELVPVSESDGKHPIKALFGEGAPEGTAENSLEATATMELMESYEYNAQFGRPAHMAFLLHADSDGPSTLDGLLRTKLLCQEQHASGAKRKRLEDVDDENVRDFKDSVGKSIVQWDSETITQAQALGVFGAVASIEVSAAARLATELSAGHMRPLLFASKLRKFIYTTEISEPAVGLAAHGWISASLDARWVRLLDKYLHSQMNQSTVSGFLGEVAAQTLLLMAWQKVAVSATLRIPFIPAFRFLEVLMGKKLESASQATADTLHLMRKHLQGGFVRVNQVVKTVSELSLDLLHDYLIRASAVLPKGGQQGFDLAVQMYFPKDPVAPEGLTAACLASGEAVADAMKETHGDVVDEAFKTEEIPTCRTLKRSARVTVDGVSVIDFQVRNKRSFESRPDKSKWLKARDAATQFMRPNAALPTVSLLLEFSSGISAEDDEGPEGSGGERSECKKPRGKLPFLSLMARARVVDISGVKNTNYVICLRRLTPSDINDEFKDADGSFQRLLEWREDITTSGNIDKADLELFKSVPHVQPDYYKQAAKPRSSRADLSAGDII